MSAGRFLRLKLPESFAMPWGRPLRLVSSNATIVARVRALANPQISSLGMYSFIGTSLAWPLGVIRA
ncbi:hypothetical protein Rcae01_02037 [Novipirellula caenicola]|uniref:Uncharacterized protein n=1 Tax=Novipirellula caenicola TaxID=1536901 RepID=A0ABP9VN10_9BACT